MTSSDASSLAQPINDAMRRIEQDPRLDPIVDGFAPVAQRVNEGPLGSVLRGEWLGHPLHPILTDVVIGCWTSSFLLDAFGGQSSRRASQRLIGFGLVSLVPTAAAGTADWSAMDEQPPRRVGVAHAASNAAAGALYFLSWRSRRRGNHAAGVAFGMAGAAVASVAGHLGGHLVFGNSDG